MADDAVQTAPAEEALPDLTGFGDVKVEVTAVLGTTQLPIEQFLKLGRGAIIELDQYKESPIEIQVNGYAFAQGDIQVVGEKIGFTVKHLIDHSKDLG